MITILSSILSGMLAGEVLYKFIDAVNLKLVMKLSFISILMIGLIYGLLMSDVLFIVMSLITGVSMIIYISVRDIKNKLNHGEDDRK